MECVQSGATVIEALACPPNMFRNRCVERRPLLLAVPELCLWYAFGVRVEAIVVFLQFG
jgi:hypothetical protein